MKREDIIKQNYEYVTCNYNGKVLVRIFKPYNMGDIPVDLIIEDAATHRMHCGITAKDQWSYCDPDNIIYDAHVVLHRYGMVCDFYVCALLIRPFSKEALDYYMSGNSLDVTPRLELMWDSRNYDKANHFQQPYRIQGDQEVPLWHLDKERLSWIEERLNMEQIIERAKTLRPVGQPTSSGLLYWVDEKKIHQESYTWDMKPLKPTGHLVKLGTIVTYHKSSMFFAKPSVDECVAQCPFNNATAFMITRIGSYNNEIDRLECETTYYRGAIPKDILERKIEW